METTTLISRLARIDNLIRKHATGSANELAEKLEITERSVYNYLHMMKSMGAPIVFSDSSRSYIYESEGNFFIGFLNHPHSLSILLT